MLEIEQLITPFPIYQYSLIEPTQITFSDRVTQICKMECPRYGKSWSCPPAVGTIAACKAKCTSYKHALLFSTVSEVVDPLDINESLATRKEHESITAQVIASLASLKSNIYTLSSESCCICDSCSYPIGPCSFPNQMHPCIESHGIVITELIEQCKMDFFLDYQHILWFSILFF